MIIAVVNSKGGVGKSTLAVHAAGWLHERGLRTCLVDADEQASSSGWLKKAEPAIRCVQAVDAGTLTGQLPRLASQHDVVIADGPAVLDATTIALTTVADVALLPVGPSLLDVTASFRMARTIYKVRFHGKRKRPLRAYTVFNRVQPRTRLARVAAAAVVKFGFPIARNVLQLRAAYAEACAHDTLAWRLGAKGETAARELDLLFDEVLKPHVPALRAAPDAGEAS